MQGVNSSHRTYNFACLKVKNGKMNWFTRVLGMQGVKTTHRTSDFARFFRQLSHDFQLLFLRLNLSSIDFLKLRTKVKRGEYDNVVHAKVLCMLRASALFEAVTVEPSAECSMAPSTFLPSLRSI